MLKTISDNLIKTLRKNDYLIRYGGDEFLIILDNIDSRDIKLIIDRIDKNINGINDFDFRITISHGISYMCNDDNFYHKLDVADKNMYESKIAKKQ